MRILFSAALFCSVYLLPIFATSHLERIVEPMAPRNIQILLEKDAQEVLLEVKGPYYIFNPHDGSRIASGLLGKRFMVRELESGLKWGEGFPGTHQIYIKPRSPETTIFVNGIQYSGSLAIYGVEGLVHIVNDIDIESYVKSLLVGQFSTPLEPEVLSALAILARTNAYYHAMRNKESFWHVAAQESGYSGSALIVSDSPIEKAVDSTRHLILVHPDHGKIFPFATAWTENSAGKTAPYQILFRKEGFSPEKGVEAPHAALIRQESKWSYEVSKRSLAKQFGVPKIDALEVFTDPFSHKVYGVRVKSGKESYDVDFFTFQKKVGKKHLLSSDFTVAEKDDTFHFTGFGRGHGVGLCLYSASALAQNGENALKILAKFFPETYLYNLNAFPHNATRSLDGKNYR